MTNNQHGQVPEALRLADALEYCDASVARQAINELRRQHARIAELEAEIAGGVQALSAAPNGWESVIDEARSGLQDSEPSDFDNSGYRAFAETVLDAVEEGLSALAASPTPPALSAAPADQSELHSEALRLSEILIAMGQGSSPEPEELWADGYEPSDGDVYVHRAALVLAMLAASPTPPAEQQARWVERWHGSGGKEFWEGWSILNAANREMIAHLGPDVDPDAVRGIVAAHNEALCGECAGTGGRWCPACAGATPSAEQQSTPKAAPARRVGTIALIGNGSTTLTASIASVLAAPQQEAQEPVVAAVFDEQLGRPVLVEGAPLLRHGQELYTAPQPAPAPLSEREAEIAMIDAAMVEMANIVPPLRRSECARLIRAALAAQGGK